MVYTVIPSRHLARFATEPCDLQIEPRVGIEPTTYRLQGGCSATELPRRFLFAVSVRQIFGVWRIWVS